MNRGTFVKFGRISILVFIGIVVISSLNVSSALEPSEKEDYGKVVIINGKRYITHPIIRINSNEEFAQMAQQEGWQGNGSRENPYIIEGYAIDAQGAGNCIYIGNTTVYFVIRNCYLYNASLTNKEYFERSAIILYNITGGCLDNNIFTDSYMGIYLQESHGNILQNNNCSNNTYYSIYLKSSSNNIIKNNNISSNVRCGICLYYSFNNTLFNNKMMNCGISLFGNEYTFRTQIISTNNTVNSRPIYYYKNMNMNNNSAPTDAGQIILGNVTHFKIENMNIINTSIAIEIGYSSYIYIANNTLSNDNCGIYLFCSKNTILKNNSHLNNSIGTYMLYSNDTIIINSITKNNYLGLRLWQSNNNTILNNTYSHCYYGIELLGGSNNTLEKIVCLDNHWGIYLAGGVNNIIANNRCSQNMIGISLKHSNNNIIDNNICTLNNLYTITLEYSNNNIIRNNFCYSDNKSGIILYHSSNNTLYDNSMENCGISLGGGIDTLTTQKISTNNTVNGKPVYYYKNANMNNATVPLNAGQIILGNVTYLKIENLYITNTSVAIELGFSSHIYIANNTCSNNRCGVYLLESINNVIVNNICSNNKAHSTGHGIIMWQSYNNIIENNTCKSNNYYGIYLYHSTENIIRNNICNSNNWYGIYLEYSNNNAIKNNTCTFNSWYGVLLQGSSNNLIENNTCSSNKEGIHLEGSNNNIIHHNVISINTVYGICIDFYGSYTIPSSYNTIYANLFYYNHESSDTYNLSCVQAYDSGTNNYWNSSFGIGNYWHDWANNNDTNDLNPQDGIVDWSYPIDGSAGAKDYYPLKNPTIVPEIPRVSSTFWIICLCFLFTIAVSWRRILYKPS